jgi:hypothetical protein
MHTVDGLDGLALRQYHSIGTQEDAGASVDKVLPILRSFQHMQVDTSAFVSLCPTSVDVD